MHACSFWIPAIPDRRRPVDRRRHSSIANRLPCATPGRDRFPARRRRPGRGCIPMTYIREDHSMKLLTEAQRTKLLANGTRRGDDHKPVVKWFNAGGTGTWLLSELDPEYPDECGFGLADLGFGTPESGSIGLLELTAYRGPFGLGIERDIHFTAAFPLSIYAEAVRTSGHIVESGPELEAAARILAGKPAGASACRGLAHGELPRLPRRRTPAPSRRHRTNVRSDGRSARVPLDRSATARL